MIEFNGRIIRDEDVELTRTWAAFYRSRGFQVVPTRVTEKRPLIQFKDYWEKPFDFDPFDPEKWLTTKVHHPPVTTNMQAMLGRHWGWMAIDMDKDGKEWYCSHGKFPRTWVTHSGGDGIHVWFRIPKDYPTPLPAGFMWKGEGKHSGVERLCDKSLLMVPPSIHPGDAARRYRFLPHYSPKKIAIPCEAPRWLLEMKPLAPPRAMTALPRPTTPWAAAPTTGRRYRFDQVLDAIPDKVGVASGWGLRFTGRVTHAGWAECHAYDRPDAKPSAVLHTETGYYVDRGGGNRMGLFDLGAQLGIAPTAQEVLQQLGDRYIR